MSTQVLDPSDQRTAAARAEALAILDTPRRVRQFEGRDDALQPSPRRRARARRPRPAPPRRRRVGLRRVIAVLVLLAQAVLLALALTLPAFQVKSPGVTGLHLLRPAAVLEAASVPRQSVFTLDSGAVRRRVEALPWVQSATVTAGLPASLHIAVVERPAVLRVRHDGRDTLLAANGATMPVGAAAAPPPAAPTPLLDDRAGAPAPPAPRLIQDLATIAQRFPAVFGCKVAAYQWGVDHIVSLWTDTGWKAVLGHLDTEDAMAALPSQIAALAALRGTLDFVHPTFGYVDLEDPSAPAVGGSPGLPDEVKAAAEPPGAASAPGEAGVPVPNPLPTPTPKPSPSASPSPSPAASARPSPQPATSAPVGPPSPAATPL